MPLKSRKTVSKNIGELVNSYEKKGKIGSSKPKNKKAAIKQAAAIALSKAKKPLKESFNNTYYRTLSRFWIE